MSAGTLKESTTDVLASAIEETIRKSPVWAKRSALSKVLNGDACREEITRALPEKFRKDVDRFINRALVTFSSSTEIQECTTASFVKCIIQAAAYGLAIDGVLAYAVKFNTKVKDEKGDRWEKLATFMPSYKGLVAVARRSGAVEDIYGDVVGENDDYTFARDLNGDHLHHAPSIRGRGKTIGAYVIVILPSKLRRAEQMTLEQIQHVRSKSKAAESGPWVTDFDEMARKTVVKRVLKMYAEDPALIDLIEHDNRAELSLEAAGLQVQPVPGIGSNALAQRLQQTRTVTQSNGQQVIEIEEQMPPLIDSSEQREEIQQSATDPKENATAVPANSLEAATGAALQAIQGAKTLPELDAVRDKLLAEWGRTDPVYVNEIIPMIASQRKYLEEVAKGRK